MLPAASLVPLSSSFENGVHTVEREVISLRYYGESACNLGEEDTLKRRVLSASSLIAAATLVAMLVGSALGSPYAAASSKTAKEVLASALAAARQESGYSYRTTFSLDDHPYVLVAQAGSTSGEQLISYNGAQIDVREFDRNVYVDANADGVKLQYGETDPTWANRWIEVTPSDGKYAAFASGVLLHSALDEVAPATLKEATTSKTLNDEKVIALTGKPNSTIGLNAGKETLYLSATSPYLPVKLVVTDKPPSEVRKLTITFSHWGKSVVVVKPSTWTPLSKTNLPD
jgi:hypothetical protein